MPNWTSNCVTYTPNKKMSLEKFKKKLLDSDNVVSIKKLAGFDQEKYLESDMSNIRSTDMPMKLIGDKNCIFSRKKRKMSIGPVEYKTLDNVEKREKDTIDLLESIGYDPDGEIQHKEELLEFNNAVAKKFGFQTSPFDWYNNNIEILGTKWIFKLEDLSEEGESISWFCNTAWSSPYDFHQLVVDILGGTIVASSEYEGEDWKHTKLCDEKSDDEEGTVVCEFNTDNDFGCLPHVHVEKFVGGGGKKITFDK